MKIEPCVVQLARSYQAILSPSAEDRFALRLLVLGHAFSVLLRQTMNDAARAARIEEVLASETSRLHLFELSRARSPKPALKLDEALTLAVTEFCEITPEPGPICCARAHRLGELLDLLLSCETGSERRRLGSYYTPYLVARALIERSFEHVVPLLDREGSEQGQPLISLCDPACGGGAFLIEAVRSIALHLIAQGQRTEDALAQAVDCAHGVDISPLAIATTEAALFLLFPNQNRVGRHFVEGDALVDSQPGKMGPTGHLLPQLDVEPLELGHAFSKIFDSPARGFDWVVGNPPWVAFQGRATQPISPERRAYYRARYFSFSGYPTTQGMFSERACELAPRGVVSLLVPSSLSDLNGYAETRRTVSSGHRVCEPLLEFGQDAFAQVVQPCFGLVAAARVEPHAGESRPFQLEERARLSGAAERVEVPACVLDLASRQVLPSEIFGEFGFQSNSKVVEHLFHRGPAPVPPFSLGLLEGRCVSGFKLSPPRVFIHPDQETLRSYNARLRPIEAYQRVAFVVRQTAAYTIAARHNGIPFRNSLIAGFESEHYDADLLVGLLNSALFRCFHLSRQRDARQATFPQVKVSHLRALPAPPTLKGEAAEVSRLSRAATDAGGPSLDLRKLIDDAVFRLFSLDELQAREVIDYLRVREPKALS